MKTIYETLEMNEIQRQVQTYCASSLGKKRVSEMVLFDDIDDLNEALDKVEEAMKLINLQGRLPLGGLSDISLLLEKANRDGTLQGDELLKVAHHLECLQSVKNYFQSSELKTHYLQELANGLVDNPHLLQEIGRCILPDGTMSDQASSTLSHLRKQMRQIQSQIRHKMDSLVKESKDMLSIDQITTKNDRLVLPVKSGYKGQIQGLIHAQSATGQTTYIEPEVVVSMNNQLSLCQVAEREEIERILYALSQMVKGHYYHFHFNLEILEELDFVFAKGQYGYIHQCCRPQMSLQDQLILKEGRHPLIDEKKVVANTVILKDHRMLLISGSNTGGKTVTLKMTGLLSFMALCGMAIPCLEATIPLFDQIYVDLGDEQSIEQSLSTFSSHMMKIIDILKSATHHSLVILDEIGSGTDPQEGASLAEAILSRFIEMGPFVLASTHYGKLKTFAKEHPEILMASVSFDLEAMRPTYQLKLDSVGQSYAIEIAQLLGLDDALVNKAKILKAEAMSEHEKLMEALEKKQEQLDLKEAELKQLMLTNQKLEKQYQHQLHQLEMQKDQWLKKAKDEANQLLEEAKENIDMIVETLNASSLKQHEIIQAKHDLDEMKFIEKAAVQKQDHDLQVGDHVLVSKMNREGDIVEILKNHMIMVSLSGLNVKLHEDEVVFMHPKTKVKKVKKASVKKTTVAKTGTYEINIIGKRYEEAMALTDKFLDDALVLGYPHVRIVHGMGTGVLRKGVRKMLEKNKHVVSYRDGGPNEGGLGATLVYFE
ncbi:endonuclease MutS2 [Longibaculum muris]|mgnify:FL=1|uniref:endonuclease MutS2 n=1 Tax=Longibaculum muris TaxID=1796628 RepID=UPI002941F9F3|nr:endonuclease MutS2 [Longibaculum muris]